MVKNLYIFRGVPGAGKSTVSHEFAGNGEYPVIEDDKYFIVEGVDRRAEDYDNEKHNKLAAQWSLDRLEEVMEEGIEKVFVANPFIKQKYLTPYFELANKYGYRVTSMVVENYHESREIKDKERLETLEDASYRLPEELKLI